MRAAFFVARGLILGALALNGAPAQAQAPGQAPASQPQAREEAASRPAAKSPKKGSKAGAKKTGHRVAGKPSAARRDELSRDVVFDGSTVNGRYLSAGEAISTVEQEKKMNDLIGVRANFNDRLKADRARLGGGQ
jgi:hypothetical protein